MENFDLMLAQLETVMDEQELEAIRLKAYNRYTEAMKVSNKKPVQYHEFKKDLLKIEEQTKHQIIKAELMGGTVIAEKERLN